MDIPNNLKQNSELGDKEKGESELQSSQKFQKLKFKKILHKLTHEPAELAINAEKSLLLAGNQFLKFFSVTNTFKLLQKLDVRKSLKSQHISHIQFMKKTPKFITKVHNKYDFSSIYIWEKSNETSWKIQHSIDIDQIIPQIILNSNEDKLIILNEYEEILIMQLKNWDCFDTIILEGSCLNQISLSPSEQILLCVSEENIFVIEKNEKQTQNIEKWVVMQKISFQFSVSSTVFYQNKYIICKLFNEAFIRIYEQDLIDKEYKSTQELNAYQNLNLKQFQFQNQSESLILIDGNNILNLSILENNFQLDNILCQQKLALFNSNSNFSTERLNCLLYIREQ